MPGECPGSSLLSSLKIIWILQSQFIKCMSKKLTLNNSLSCPFPNWNLYSFIITWPWNKHFPQSYVFSLQILRKINVSSEKTMRHKVHHTFSSERVCRCVFTFGGLSAWFVLPECFTADKDGHKSILFFHQSYHIDWQNSLRFFYLTWRISEAWGQRNGKNIIKA